MHVKTNLMSWVALALVAGAFAVFTGCEKDKSGSDADQFFKDNPYVSDPRNAPDSRKLEIDPPTKNVSSVGEKISFSVKGGSGTDYRWNVANTAYGSIQRQGNKKYAIYTVKQLADNSVIVSDSEGSAGIASIIASTTSLSITPNGAEYATNDPVAYDGEILKLLVTGGMPPYGEWVISGSSLVSVVDPSRPLGEFVINNPDPSFLAGVYESTITIHDTRGNRVSVTIKLTVTP